MLNCKTRLLATTKHLPNSIDKPSRGLLPLHTNANTNTNSMTAMPVPAESTQNGQAQSHLFNNPEFAARYKQAEYITGAFGVDLLRQMGFGNTHHPGRQLQSEPVTFLDLACGTGIVSKHAISLLDGIRSTTRLLPEDRFTCLDFAPKMLEVLESRLVAEEWGSKLDHAGQIEIQQGDMKNTKLPSGAYSHVACNFGPVVVPEPEKVLGECFRVLEVGGVAGWTAWCEVAWRPDLERAIREIRTEAKKRIENGNGLGTEEDQKLCHVPDMLRSDEMLGLFAGIDVRKLRAEGVPEADIPRWDETQFFKAQVEEAGFIDVEVELVQKEFSIGLEMVAQMTTPVVGILRTFWSDEEKKATDGLDLSKKMNEWWKRRFEESDVKDGLLLWNRGKALVVTGRKP